MALEKETGSTTPALGATPAQRATPPHLRRGAFANSPPDSGGAGALATGVVTGVVTSCPYRVTYLPVDREGLLNLADLEAAITDQTAVVSLMWANNETGVLFPVEKIAEICRSHGGVISQS